MTQFNVLLHHVGYPVVFGLQQGVLLYTIAQINICWQLTMARLLQSRPSLYGTVLMQPVTQTHDSSAVHW